MIAAAAAVAMNASVMSLSPGRTTIAAIVAATAANASTITTSIGGRPFTAMGLNIGGAKLLVTFAAADSRTQASVPACIPPPNRTRASVPVWLAGLVPPTRVAPVLPPNQTWLQCRFDWRVRFHPLGQHQYHHRYLEIQPCPEEESQLFDAIPQLRKH